MIKVVEREGRYFLQDEYGEEEEWTLERMRLFNERQAAISKELLDYADTYNSKFINNPLTTGGIPKKAWSYVNIDIFFRGLKVYFQSVFDEGGELNSCFQMCDLSISQLKKERAAPFADKDLIKYFLAGWKETKRFLSFFPSVSGTPHPGSAQPHATPAPPVARPIKTIADLCLAPFTPADLTTLLLYVKAIPTEPPYRWAHLPNGKGKGCISKLAAALCVLSEEKRFSPDVDDWSTATEDTYGIPLGKKVLTYRYNATNNRRSNGSATFDTATEKAQKWLSRWKPSKTDSY